MVGCLTSRERLYAVAFSLGLGLLLSMSFLPAVGGLFYRLLFLFQIQTPEFILIGERLAFPATAGLLYLASQRWPNMPPLHPLSSPRALTQSILPLTIAYLYGVFGSSGLPQPSFFETASLWILVSVPLGEEWLFRGWFFNLGERIFGPRYFTQTNPLSVGIWTSSIAFSVWHLQNLLVDPWPVVLFQSMYTFFAGLWLGQLRARTQSVIPAILAHAGLNLATRLGA